VDRWFERDFKPRADQPVVVDGVPLWGGNPFYLAPSINRRTFFLKIIDLPVKGVKFKLLDIRPFGWGKAGVFFVAE